MFNKKIIIVIFIFLFNSLYGGSNNKIEELVPINILIPRIIEGKKMGLTINSEMGECYKGVDICINNEEEIYIWDHANERIIKYDIKKNNSTVILKFLGKIRLLDFFEDKMYFVDESQLLEIDLKTIKKTKKNEFNNIFIDTKKGKKYLQAGEKYFFDKNNKCFINKQDQIDIFEDNKDGKKTIDYQIKQALIKYITYYPQSTFFNSKIYDDKIIAIEKDKKKKLNLVRYELKKGKETLKKEFDFYQMAILGFLEDEVFLTIREKKNDKIGAYIGVCDLNNFDIKRKLKIVNLDFERMDYGLCKGLVKIVGLNSRVAKNGNLYFAGEFNKDFIIIKKVKIK